MESVHKELLRSKHSGLIEAIQHVDQVVDKLVEFGLLTKQMKADIMEKPQTMFDRVRELLTLLPRRGPLAYTLFCQALEGCDEMEAMKLLGLETGDTDEAELQDPRCHIDLGGDVFVTANSWNDMVNIQIRKYKVYPTGKSYPTKRGIVLSLKHWLELPCVFFCLGEAMKSDHKEAYAHVGSNIYATLDQHGVDIRQWEKNIDEGKLIPTSKGILLSHDQWDQLKLCVSLMPVYVPGLKDMVPCLLQEDHRNYMGAMRCSFCHPNDWLNY